MPSSISNSESTGNSAAERPTDWTSPADRIPSGLGRVWIGTLVMTVTLLVTAEIISRHIGHRPMVEDDARLWIKARNSVRPNDHGQIVLVGSSRIHADVDLQTLSSGMGSAPVVQLAIDGSTGTRVFGDLSRDDTFRGVVIFDLVRWAVFDEKIEPDRTSEGYLQARAHAAWIDPIETRLRMATQTTFAFEQFSIDVDRIRRHKRVHPPAMLHVDPDRGRHTDFSDASPETLTQWRNEKGWRHPTAGATLLREHLEILEQMVRRIQSRGGRVVIVRFPSTGAVLDQEEASCPRAKYWDVLAAGTSAITFHWEDDPRMRRFQCPDESHLDQRDQVDFTKLLAENLMARLFTPH